MTDRPSEEPQVLQASDATDRDQLILDHVPLLHHIVGRMSYDVPGSVERDDLLGWGMLGLIAAADTWDATRGHKFSTFAFPKIRGAILDELRRLDFLPRGVARSCAGLERAVSDLEQEQGDAAQPRGARALARDGAG